MADIIDRLRAILKQDASRFPHARLPNETFCAVSAAIEEIERLRKAFEEIAGYLPYSYASDKACAILKASAGGDTSPEGKED